MKCAIYIRLDKDLKQDYCVLQESMYDESLNINIYTNGKKEIDFKSISYLTFKDSLYKDFVTFFSYGRNVISNAESIWIAHTGRKEKNTKKDNRELMKVLELNKAMLRKKVYVDVGAITLSEEDLDSLTPLKKCKYASITFDDTDTYHAIEEVFAVRDIAEEIVKRVKKYNFSQMEQLLYAYDIIRTNFEGNKTFEAKTEKVLQIYKEPSYCYSLLFREVLNKLGIKNKYSLGYFYYNEMRAYNIVYVKDEEYDIEGVYYFDIGNSSKQRFKNSLIDNSTPENIKDNFINNYKFFCKPKSIIRDIGSFEGDLSFGDFDEKFMEAFDYAAEQKGINGIYELRGLINVVGYFIDGRTVIDEFHGIKSEDELDEIRENAERYSNLFYKIISGEDFLEMLFNVRAVEYIENKELFPLSIDALKKCMYNSHFPLSSMMSEFSEDMEYEEEDIDSILEESFNTNFEEAISSSNIEEKIKKLKLSLNKDINKPKKDDNN